MSNQADDRRVPVEAVLNCLERTLGKHLSRHRRTDLESPGLVVVALDERQRFARLIDEVIRAADGLLVEAAIAGEGVRIGEDTSGIRSLIEEVEAVLVAYNELDPEAGLSLRFDGSMVSIVGTTSYETANLAQRSFCDLILALFHPDLRGGPLSALLWADDAFDDQRRTLIWPLLMRLPTLLGRPNQSTLLLIAGDTTIDFDLHCEGQSSLDYRINSDGCDRRRPYEANVEAIRDISRLSGDDAPLTVLFLGAGASVVEGFPTGNQLRNQALARQVGYPVDWSNFDGAAREFYRQLANTESRLTPTEESSGEEKFVATLTLERVLLEEQSQENRPDCTTIRSFARDHAAIFSALRDAAMAGKYEDDPMVQLLAMRKRLVLLTVNFDQVIEAKAGDHVRAYVDEAQLATLSGDLDEYRKSGGPVPLVKLHGDIGTPTSIVANVEETAGGLTGARLSALDTVIAAMKQQVVRPWWYVGYSMRDLDLAAHWQLSSFADDMAEHWVAPFVDPAVRQFIDSARRARWDRTPFRYSVEDRVVTLTAADFYKLLWEQVSGVW